ncbi:MAG: hypothetical protein ACR2RE_25870 [Geminicoccaceae bacterium]
MQWLIIARGGRGAGALKKRPAARPVHPKNAAKLRAKGHHVIDGPLTDKAGDRR